MCPNFGTPKIINFPFGKLFPLFLGVPIIKHITVIKDLFIFFLFIYLFFFLLSDAAE